MDDLEISRALMVQCFPFTHSEAIKIGPEVDSGAEEVRRGNPDVVHPITIDSRPLPLAELVGDWHQICSKIYRPPS